MAHAQRTAHVTFVPNANVPVGSHSKEIMGGLAERKLFQVPLSAPVSLMGKNLNKLQQYSTKYSTFVLFRRRQEGRGLTVQLLCLACGTKDPTLWLTWWAKCTPCVHILCTVQHSRRLFHHPLKMFSPWTTQCSASFGRTHICGHLAGSDWAFPPSAATWSHNSMATSSTQHYITYYSHNLRSMARRWSHYRPQLYTVQVYAQTARVDRLPFCIPEPWTLLPARKLTILHPGSTVVAATQEYQVLPLCGYPYVATSMWLPASVWLPQFSYLCVATFMWLSPCGYLCAATSMWLSLGSFISVLCRSVLKPAPLAKSGWISWCPGFQQAPSSQPWPFSGSLPN